MRPIPTRFRNVLLLLLATAPLIAAVPLSASPAGGAKEADALPGGELRPAAGQGDIQPFSLKHTDVQAEITGNVAQVRVNQVFQNPYDRPIEAVYVFPLPRRAAVDDMEIRLRDRVIRGVIKKREEARALYDAARRSGRTAALLDQERPNIFTQSVANILPGEEVVVSLRFFDVLPYDTGFYEFTFPMVVGPRFHPGAPIGGAEGEGPPGTTDVPDASRITPPVLRQGERAGRDVSLEVNLQAGMPLQDLASPSHAVDVESQGPGNARIRLRQEDSIPNKDFVLRYRLDGPAPGVVLIPHRTDGPGYFLMMVQPEAAPSRARIAPKEMIFVVDCSGSMTGFPIEKVKEAMRYALENLNPLDNFQIIRFSDEVEVFAPEPVPATPSHVARALEYVESLSGSGGTIMLDGVRAALSYPEDPQRLRIVSFMTDGYIGNEDQILEYLRDHLGGARLFSFGVGSSPNRYLLDKMAEFGRGSVQYLLLKGEAAGPVHDFYEKIRSPYLTDLEVDWGGFQVSDIYPSRIPDLFLGQPVVLLGRYERAGAGEIVLSGRLGGQPYEQRLGIRFPERSGEGGAIASLWARFRIEELSGRDLARKDPAIAEEITRVALDHRLVSSYTSFVAVEEWSRTTPGEPACVPVPVPLPDGTDEKGFVDTAAGSAFTETIRVAGKESVVNTESTFISTAISSEFISGLPVLGSDYQDVVVLAPGVTDVDNSGNPNLHGARDTDVVTLADSLAVSDPSTGDIGGNLDVESIEEIEVITSGAAASYSRAQGGFVNIVTGPAGTGAPRVVTRRWDVAPVFCRLAAIRNSYHVGEKIELYVAIKNLSRREVKVPGILSVSCGTAPFRILTEDWSEAPNAVPGTCTERRRVLRPGEWVLFWVVLNGEGGYQLDRPGLYHLVFLGSELGLPDSTQLTVRIDP